VLEAAIWTDNDKIGVHDKILVKNLNKRIDGIEEFVFA